MFKTYIAIALRRLQREKTYVLISIASLALGIASVLVLYLHLRRMPGYNQNYGEKLSAVW